MCFCLTLLCFEGWFKGTSRTVICFSLTTSVFIEGFIKTIFILLNSENTFLNRVFISMIQGVIDVAIAPEWIFILSAKYSGSGSKLT